MANDARTSVKRNRTSALVRIEKHTEIFATMCPDEILEFYGDYGTRAYYTTLMLGDVSGFTELTEKYTNSGKGGPSKLTETLNSYIGPMVQEILSHHGDVLKFSGDAFIVMWKLHEGTVMRDLASEAVQTACIIQKHFGKYETDVGVTLRVKLAIASGRTYFTSIGDPRKISHYIITGQPVWDVKLAEGLCKGGDIIVAPSSWQWVDPSEYVFKILPDGVHTLILSCNLMLDQAKGIYEDSDIAVNTDTKSDQNSERLFPKLSVLNHIGPDTLRTMRRNRSEMKTFSSPFNTDYTLRPKVIEVTQQRLKDELQSYVLRPVVRSVELDEPLEYLTEMRQVVIIFLNVVTANISPRKLISLVNDIYKLTCGIVSGMQGCVNKTSLFDKDLMFLCIFGLRGDKHEFESQIGLRCAAKLKNELNNVKGIKSVTIGVTTGMTYCGVVGHVLRREYTVIGMAVNKAARLMVAYNNKVVCDRESFLHSRLQARHFMLQEPKDLKGITHVGPIYEFLEKSKPDDTELISNLYPLLGREIEMKLFKLMFADVRKNFKSKSKGNQSKKSLNVLIIRGEPRIGKSRLLDEISGEIPKDIACNYINLITADKETPFGLIHLIFSAPLQFTASTTSQTRENTLLYHLKFLRYPEFLCALNPVFNVKYRVSSYYLNLTFSDRRSILQKLIFKLAQSCFTHPWVVITDDADNADSESLSLLPTIIEHENIFFVFTFGEMEITDRKRQISKILEKAKIIDLMGLDKWFHAGLACQLLHVSAIPAELEKVIQEKSMGNPGWIESYLLSLLQIGGIQLNQIPKNRLKETGLVAPPAIMLEQRNRSNIYNGETDETIDEPTDGWRMYQATYGESYICVDHKKEFTTDDDDGEAPPEDGNHHERQSDPMRNQERSSKNQIHDYQRQGENVGHRQASSEAFEDNPRSSNRISDIPYDETSPDLADKPDSIDVCLVPNISILDEVTPEVTMDVLILKLFDSLTPLDQYLLKCAAVLGETVDRSMLEKLMVESSAYDVAVAVVNLFNMRILGCAAGDFARSNAPIMFFRNIKSPHLGTEIKCACPRVGGRTGLDGFPVYADCRLMRFKIAKFRETTYRLLTEYQKIELHKKALKYLQRNTRRCGPCGKGFFTKLMGKVYEENGRESKRMINDYEELSDFGEGTSDVTDRDDPAQRKMGRRTSLVLSHSVGLVIPNTFETVDFRDCQCNLILINAYAQILEHCRGIDRKDKTLTTILEFVEVLLETCNVAYATKLLCDAEEILGQIFKGDEDELVRFPLLKAKIRTLQGKCHLQIRLVDEALKCFADAVETLRYDFPKTTPMINIKSKILLGYQKVMLRYWGKYLVGMDEGDAADYNDQLAICLSQLFIVFRMKEMHDHARLAAIWSLNSALTSNNNFVTMCHAFANMIIIADNYQYQSMIPWLENSGISFCNQRVDALELQELTAIIELYTNISFSRLLREERVQAIHLGNIAMRLARTVKSVRQELMIFPRIIQSLMVEKKIEKIVSLMGELESISNSIIDQSGRLWYYAFCIDLQLDCGITITHFNECEKFYQREGEPELHLNDPEAKKRFFTSMWLWCVRMGDWERAIIWKQRRVSINYSIHELNVLTGVTALKNLEGLIIYYVHKKDSRNSKAMRDTLLEIERQFKIAGKIKRFIKVCIFRYTLLRAYFYMVRGQFRMAMKQFDKFKTFRTDGEHNLLASWAEYCKKVIIHFFI
ncbi:uncharacterized protein LOC135162667 [Diachasmimorpha longicaudata]|uniref:uncharacterized protein LOC135162667 n=1 Tax=Diachasmimorpha longicaudata TaxID=58733 RepID=UPI0030B8DCF3